MEIFELLEACKKAPEPLILAKQQKMKMIATSNKLRQTINKQLQSNPGDAICLAIIEQIDRMEALILNAREK